MFHDLFTIFGRNPSIPVNRAVMAHAGLVREILVEEKKKEGGGGGSNIASVQSAMSDSEQLNAIVRKPHTSVNAKLCTISTFFTSWRHGTHRSLSLSLSLSLFVQGRPLPSAVWTIAHDLD